MTATGLLLSLGTSSLAVLGMAQTAQADPTPGVIASAGPLTSITTTTDLNCDVRYAGDSAAEFYGATACGTLVAIGGTLYGPASIPAGSNATPRTAYTPVSQTGPTGTGTATNPFKVVTTVDLGTSGVSLTQTDTYLTGQQSYQTTVQLDNGGGAAVDALVYRAGDCYLANSDYGLGNRGESSVACVASGAGSRVEQWIPVTGGAHSYEANYSQVWSQIGSQQLFPDTCQCDDNTDNGAGLSWLVEVPPSGQASVSHLTAFSAANAVTDRDGDGLLDEWETDGYDADGDGVIDLDLPAMGASPDHKDLFVEADWMTHQPTCIFFLCWGGRSFAPNQAALDDVTDAFASAPVSNPDGHDGITLHIDAGPGSVMNPVTGAKWGARSRGTSVAWTHSLGSNNSSEYNWSAYNNLQNTDFDAVRRDVFHYALFADTYAGSDSSGIARVSDANFEGDSFMLTDGDPSWGSGFTRRQESGSFMHEFGHTLGLHHGGSDDANYKPNYQSIMSYAWQLGGRPLDYSEQQLGTLDENALDEGAGLPGATGPFRWYCGGAEHTSSTSSPVDWNCSGGTDSGTVAQDVNQDGTRGTLTGWDDWMHLLFDGGAVGAFGASDLHDEDPPLSTSTDDEPTTEELKATDSFGSEGDGSVRAVGPSVLLKGATGQVLRFHVTNVGSTSASYRLHLSGLAGLPASVDLTVPELGEEDVDVPVDGGALAVGQTTVAATLTAVDSAHELSEDELSVTVPDTSDPTVQSQLGQIQQQLPVPGLPADLSSDLSSAIGQVLPGAPTLPGAPKLVAAPTFGPPKVGTTVTATAGSWTPTPATTAYQWLVGGEPIAGATQSSYAVPAALVSKSLSVRVTVTAQGGTSSATSAAATVAKGTLHVVKKPKVTGPARVGATLRLRLSTGKLARGGAKVKVRWLVGGSKVKGATGKSFTLTRADRGKKVRVRVTYVVAGYATLVTTVKAGTVA